jgi:hypothetical protein
VVPDQTRTWIVIVAAIVVVLAVATTIALVDLPGERILTGGQGLRPGEAVLPDLPQATWEMSVHASGVDGKLTAPEKKALEGQRPELQALVKRVYDSLFIHPNRLADTLKENFAEPAAVALRRAGAGATEPGRVATTLRRATIGIEATGGARMAVASVTVRAVGDNSADPVVHRSALWLERARGDWKVVAFDLRQGPAPDPSGDKKAGEGKNTNRKSR